MLLPLYSRQFKRGGRKNWWQNRTNDVIWQFVAVRHKCLQNSYVHLSLTIILENINHLNSGEWWQGIHKSLIKFLVSIHPTGCSFCLKFFFNWWLLIEGVFIWEQHLIKWIWHTLMENSKLPVVMLTLPPCSRVTWFNHWQLTVKRLFHNFLPKHRVNNFISDLTSVGGLFKLSCVVPFSPDSVITNK